MGTALDRTTNRPRNASEVSGKSRRQWAPRRIRPRGRGGDDRARNAQHVDDLVARDRAHRKVVGRARELDRAFPRRRRRPASSRTTPQSADIMRCTEPRRAARVGGALLRKHDRIGFGRVIGREIEHAGHCSRRFRFILAVEDSLDDTAAEDEAVEQRVRGQAVRAVHAAAGSFTARPEMRQRRRAVEIRDDTTGEVVRGGRDGKPFSRRVESDFLAHGPDRREALGKVADHRRVEPHMLLAGARHPLVDRARDDVARREIAERMLVDHERDAGVVTQDGAFAAQRLGQQRPGHRRIVQRRRVELDELEIGAGDARLQREGDAVAGRERRIGRHGEALPGATGREHDVDRADDLDLAVRLEREHARCTGSRSTSNSIANQPSRTSMSEIRTASTSARSISAPVASPPACTTRASECPPSRASSSSGEPSDISVSNRAPSAASSRDSIGSFGDEDAHGIDVAQTHRRPAACRRGADRASPAMRAPLRRRPARSASRNATARPWSAPVRKGRAAPHGAQS